MSRIVSITSHALIDIRYVDHYVEVIIIETDWILFKGVMRDHLQVGIIINKKFQVKKMFITGLTYMHYDIFMHSSVSLSYFHTIDAIVDK